MVEVDTKETDPMERMCEMYFLIKDLINKSNPDLVVIEGIQFQRNYHTFSILSRVQGQILAILFEKNIAFYIVEPTKWKSFCGIKGRKRAEQKDDTIQMVKTKFNLDVGEDIADAIGIGLWGINTLIK